MTGAISQILLLPGLDGTGRLFRWFAAEYKGTIPLKAISYPADARFGYPELTAYVRDIIGNRNAIVLGESFSGPIAVEIAASMPGQIKGLILAATFVRSPWPPWFVRLAARFNPAIAPKFAMNAILRGGHKDPDLNLEIERILAEMASDVRSKRLAEVAGVDVRQRLNTVQCPVLVLHGTHDWLVPRPPAAKTLKLNRDVTMNLIKGPHMLLQTNAGAAARTIEAFVGRIGSTT